MHRFTSRIDRFKPVKGSWHGGTVEQGGGTLLDLGPHLVDQALHLFGPAELVHAELRHRPRRVPARRTTSSCTCGTPAGCAPRWPPGWRPRRRGRGSRSTGDRGGYLIDGFDVQEEQLKNGDSPASPRAGLGGRAGVGVGHGCSTARRELASMPSERGRWDTFYPAVARAVAGHGPPPVDPQDAVATARVLDAARMSSATGTVVSLV